MAEHTSRTVRDMRALGVGAPLRAGYEASKQFGGHTLVFRFMVSTSRGVDPGRSPFDVPSVPDEVRARTIAAADRVVDGTITLFSQDLDLGDLPDWHAVLHTDGSWPVDDWWRIDLRSDSRPGDIKWAWELGRHRHLVLLARAAYLDPNDDRYLRTLERQLCSWVEQNPPETGVHWYSNLEIALRSIAWLQILSLVGERLAPDLRTDMWRHLRHSGRHLVADLPYTVSTMRNNHLLGDALGLVALGLTFGGRTGARWYAIGNRLFNKQLARHMRPDGSMIEDSVSYHRFVLEMLSMRVVLGGASAEVHDALASAAQFLARLGVLEGPVPQYGDWDEGRLFVVAGDATPLDGSVLLALALTGDGALAEWRSDHDEVAWFVGEGVPVSPQSAVSDGSDVGGGIGRASVGRYTVWLKAGSSPSHGHADLSSVAVAIDDRWLVGDPGTATYNGPIETRNRFRSSAAHNVVRIDGIDQLQPHRVFRWRHTASGILGEPVQDAGSVTMWCVHDAYTRLNPPRRAARVVTVSAAGVVVCDSVSGDGAHLALALPLGPECVWDGGRSAVTLDRDEFSFTVACVDGPAGGPRLGAISALWSRTYGSVEPSVLLECVCSEATGLRWSIGGDCAGGRGRGPDPVVEFGADDVRLRMNPGQRTPSRTVRY